MVNQIGHLKLENKLFLAPMADVNDIAFRLLCKKAGCALTYTGMCNPLNPQELELGDKPALQIFCTSDKGLREFVKKYKDKVSLFDFNLGCPAKTAKECGFGSFMHNKLEEIEKILKAIKENCGNLPVTVKLRKSKQTKKIIKIAEKYCDAICIHPRTQEQGYGGEPDVEFAREIKKRTKLPVIYSGNVSEENARELLKEFDFLMIGRGAMGDPGIFARLLNKKQEFSFQDYLKLAEKHKVKFKNIKMQAMYFTKGKEGATDLRREIAQAKTIREIERIMN